MTYSFIDEPDVTEEAPVLYLLHGTGGDEHQFMAVAAQIAPGARRVGIRGDVSEGGALRYFRRLAEGIYDMDDLARATKKLTAFMADNRGAARAVWALGYSNGANVLASALFAGAGVDRAALLHPLIPFTPQDQPALAGRQVLITAGERDPIAPLPMSSQLARWFEQQGADTRLVVHSGGHELRSEELAAAHQLFG